MPADRIANPPTSRGAATKQRIVEAAADLIYAGGAGRVSLNEVMAASSASKSQVYHYFTDKDALVREVIDFQARRVLQANATHLDGLDSFEALRAWRDAVVATTRVHIVNGCPLGSLAYELTNQSEEARRRLAQSFVAWADMIAAGLARMQGRGEIAPAVDTQALATAVLAALQGGILLSKTARDSKPLELALDMALDHVERHAT